MADSLTITKAELFKLIKDLKNRTAPGRSGLDKMVLLWFYNYFPEVLLEYFGDLIRNPKWELDPATDYLKVRKIIFLAKKNKDPKEVGNYRPISLLETVYKVISKFLIEKIALGVYETVSKDQFGFIPTRVMSNCSLTLLAIINALKSRHPGSFLFFADISAAFDCAKQQMVHTLLSKLYPDSPVPLQIALLDRGGRGVVSVNGGISAPIDLTQGTGQGDPASTIKFSALHHLWLSMIAHAIENAVETDNTTGPLRQLRIDMEHIRAPGFDAPVATTSTRELMQKLPKSLRPVAFADDSVFAFKIPNTEEAREALMRLLADLAALTGLRVNVRKSEVLLMQSNLPQAAIDLVSKFGEVKTCVTHLGVDIAVDYDVGYEATYQKGAQAMDKALSRVSAHTGTSNLLVKAQATNSLVTAVNLHRYRVYPPSNKTVKEQWNKIRQAMWTSTYMGKSYGRPKIAKHKVTRPLKQGGLGLINPEHAATTSVLSSMGSLFKHCYINPTCTFNALVYVTESTKKTA